MQIRFYANLRTLVGKDSLEIDDSTVNTLHDVFHKLIELYPDIQPQLMDGEGGLRKDVPVFVNGRNPRLDGAGMDLRLSAEDIISLFSPIASGKMNVEVMRDR